MKGYLWLKIHRFFAQSNPHDTRIIVRMLVVLGIIGVIDCFIIGQAFIYQIGKAETLSSRGEKNVKGSIRYEGRRGSIYDRNGKNIIALTTLARSVGFVGADHHSVDRLELSYTLAYVLSLNPEDVLRKIIAEDKFAMIKRHIKDEEATTLMLLDIPGVELIDEPRRYYPMGRFLGSVLGYVSKDGSGLAGLELYYDKFLKPKKAKIDILRDVAKRGYYQDSVGQIWNLDGSDLILTIDTDIQMILEAELEVKIMEEKALGGMAIVIDPYTGEILGMASAPTLDPNIFEEECGQPSEKDDGSNPCRNKVIQYVYEPGSVGKVMTAAAAFSSGKFSASDLVDGQMGRCSVGKFTITDVHKMGVGTVRDAIKFSSNCAMKNVALKLGADLLYENFLRYGLGSPTGIDLPGEAGGVLRNPKYWGLTGTATAGYGYGYSVTLLQLAVVTSMIVNDGVRMKPYIVKEIRTKDGETLYKASPVAVDNPIPRKAIHQLMDAMTAVVMEDGGTAKPGRPTGYTAAGKTGTARATKINKGYSYESYLCSFVGWAPAENPKIVVGVTIIDPKVNHYGGTVAAPVFKNVVEQVLPLLGIMPKYGEGEPNEDK